MEAPSPQCIGREFVRQYYTLLHEAPEHLHRFYTNDSSFVHGGVDESVENALPITGQQGIHDKIVSLKFTDCRAKIRQVDSQSTIGNAVVVQVTGELSNNGMPMRRFMQTFVLVPQSPKNYYVHNDIFRYQDWVFGDADTDNEALDEGVDSEQEMMNTPPGEEMHSPIPFYDTTVTSISSQQQHSPLSNGIDAAEDTEQFTTEEQEEEVIDNEETELPVENHEDDVPEETVNEEVKIESEEENVEIDIKPSGPVTWAAMLQNSKAPVIAPSIPAPTAKVSVSPSNAEIKIPSSEHTASSQRIPRQQRERASTKERDGSRQDDDFERSRRYPDCFQVFVGNLPLTLTEEDLRSYFHRHMGKVVDVRINKKSTNASVPNYGFVVFDDEKVVQKVLANRQGFTLEDGHRINVEEKKQRGDVSGRPGSGTRAAGRGPFGGFGRGGSTQNGRGIESGRGSSNRRGGFGGGGTRR